VLRRVEAGPRELALEMELHLTRIIEALPIIGRIGLNMEVANGAPEIRVL
jgi:hypothetical protein